MDYMTTQEASQRWGYPVATIRKWCKDGLLFAVVKAEKKSGRWQIPSDTKCPKPIRNKEK